MIEDKMFYRVVTTLDGELGSIDAARVDWASDGSGVWVRDTSSRGEDLFVSHLRILFIKKLVRDDVLEREPRTLKVAP